MATSDSPKSIAATRTLQVAKAAAPATGSAQITISGTGFGTRTSSFEQYQNYNDVADGTDNGQLGGTSSSAAAYLIPTVQSNLAHDGGKSLEVTYPALGNHFPKLRRLLPDSDTLYASFYFRYTGSPTSGDVGIFKIFRCGQDVYLGAPMLVDTIRGGDGLQTSMDASVFLEDAANPTVGNRLNRKHANQWNFLEYYFRLSTPNVADGEVVGRCNGEEVFSNRAMVTRQLAASKINSFINMLDGRDRDAYEMTVYQSLEYASHSRARVIITDSAVYANSTKWEPQPIESWADNSIVVTKEQGALASGTNYIYAWDEDDNMVVNADPVTL